MAYIRPHKEGWRAEVFKRGQRLSKKFPDRSAAEQWATETERKIDGRQPGQTPSFDRPGPALVTSVPVTVLRARRSIPYYEAEIVSGAVPTSIASGVYFLIRRGEVVYVGQSLDVLHRIARHRREGRIFDAYSVIECVPEQLDELERTYIKAFVPEDNWSLGNPARQALPTLPDTPEPASSAILGS